MSRRKQPHPLHLDTLDQLSSLLDHGSCNEEEDEGGIGDEHVCGKCRLEFVDLSDFLHHKRTCTRKCLVLVGGDESSDELEDADEMGISPMDYKEDSEKYAEDLSTLPYLMSLPRVKSCFPDNSRLPTTLSGKKPPIYTECENQPLDVESFEKSEIYASQSDESDLNDIKKGTSPELGSFPTPQTLPQYLLMQPVPDTNVTLQALQNTRVAVAQQGAGNTNLSHLALHTALYTLQQQQIIQLHQVIQQLQTQLANTTPTSTNPLIPNAPTVGSLTGSAALTPPQSTDGNNGGILALTTTASSLRTLETITQAQNLSVTTTATPTSTCQSSSSTDNPISVVSAPPPAPPHEPNTLELLQRHTEQALQNTMAGSSFLLNGLSGLGNSSDILRFCKKGDVKKEGGEEAFFRHRCRFCGKVFGSDSALQIHIRSHTGERPFKCNVCGNRFSTKGNLKVHFGRHKEKYPHIKMNPHPVPLHLDNLHPPIEPPEASETPPILTQSSPCQTVAPSLQPPNLIPAQPLPLVTHCHDRSLSSPSGAGIHENGRQSDNDNMQSDHRSVSPNGASNLSDDSGGSVGDDYATDENGMKDTDQVRYDDDIDNDDDDSFSVSPKIEQKEADDNADEETKPLTSENNVLMRNTTSIPSYVSSSAPTFPYFFHPTLSPPSSIATMCYPPLSTPPLTSTPSSRISYTSNANHDGNEQVGPSPDPNVYQDLLPKPGSNDNSWESLMEVTKTSETSKLQQLVDNIEHKLSDPNQCLFCHRVLSCKSALQMHYRTHTGERPFKCKICSRAFTTKGNLKTHMGVHRAKSSLQVLHQCPVCHKQFTNSLVLQQHIRMHTGEPTDMHPEQIMANEVRQGHLLSTSFPRPTMPSLLPTFTSPSSLPPRSSPAGPPNICQTPKSSEAPSLSSSPVRSSSTPTESVIKTTSKQPDNQSMDESSSPTTIGNNSRPPSTKQERSATPQPPVLISSSSPNISSVVNSPRVSSPNMDKPIVTTAPYSPAYTTSLVALENHVKAINTTIPQTLPFSPFGMGLAMGSFFRYEDAGFMNRNPPKDLNSDKSPAPTHSFSPSPNTSRAGSDASADERSTPGSIVQSESPVSVNGNHMRLSSGVITTKVEGGALDLTPKNSIISVPPSVPDIQLFTSPLAGLPFPTTPGRLSTTCRICFKTFACNSALEIHYRSHTKERPFKCNVCDRGFTTKGNMKQHLLTHKSRDLQPLLFASTDNSVPDSETNSSTNVTSPRTSSPGSMPFETNSNHNSDKKDVVMTPISSVSTTPTPVSVTSAVVTAAIMSTPSQVSPPVITASSLPKSIKIENEGSVKRPLSDHTSVNPSKQRPSGIPKHFCHICQKPFSSASALQIHNRTHSGEKPFKCVVCGRAFTTKGNLKVHMNTHMAQNNGNSRRGRRMSLEFQPPPLPAHGKQEYPHHARPDLYFPYLPPGYINGITCPPKMNEISVIQSAAGITNGNISTPSTMNLTPAVSMMTPIMTLGQHQPFIRKQAQQNNDSDGSSYVDPRSPDEAENLKIQPSPSPPMESASPVRPIPSSPSTTSDNAACWNWKTACNVCNKICSSSSDLELHLKTHCNPVIHDTVRSVSQTAKNLAS